MHPELCCKSYKKPSYDVISHFGIISYDKRILEDNLFLKQDLLGLATLSIIQDTLSLIGVNDFEEFDYEMIQQNAKAIFDTRNAMKNMQNRENIELL